MSDPVDLASYFEKLDLRNPDALAGIIQASTDRMAHLLLSLGLVEADTLDSGLTELFIHVRQKNSPFDPAIDSSFASWLYGLALSGLPALRHHSERRALKRQLPDLLARPPHSLTIEEISEVLKWRERRVERHISQSVAKTTSKTANLQVPQVDQAALLAAVTRGADPDTPPRIAMPGLPGVLRETALAGTLIAVVLAGILWFNRSDQSARGVDLFNPTPERLPEIQAPEIFSGRSLVQTQPEDEAAVISLYPEITDDGRYVIFTSNDPHLVPHDNNDGFDVFLREIGTGEIRRISQNLDGSSFLAESYLGSSSADGSRIVFLTLSPARGAVVYFSDWQNGRLEAVNFSPSSTGTTISEVFSVGISGDGQTVAYWAVDPISPTLCAPGHPCYDLYIYETNSRETTRVPVGASFNIGQVWTSISGDGARLAFTITEQDGLYDQLGITGLAAAVLLDWRTADFTVLGQEITRHGGGNSAFPAISSDGERVLYYAGLSSVDEDSQPVLAEVRMVDLRTGEARTINRAPSGETVSLTMDDLLIGWGDRLDISANGEFAIFTSGSTQMAQNENALSCASLEITQCFGTYIYAWETDRLVQLDVSPILQEVHNRFNVLLIYPTISEDGNGIALNGADTNILPPCGLGGCISVWTLNREDGRHTLASESETNDPVGNLESGWVLNGSLPGPAGWVNEVNFHPDGTLFAAARQDGALLLANPEESLIPDSITDRGSPFNAVVFSPDGDALAAGDAGGDVLIWDLASRSVESRLTGHPGIVFDLAYSPDGSFLAVGAQRALWVWESTRTGWVLAGVFEQSQVQAVAFTTDGRYVASVAENEVRVRRVSDGELIARLGGHSEGILDLLIYENVNGDELLVSAGKDHVANIWQILPDGSDIRFTYRLTLEHDSWVSAIATSPDGSMLATGTFDSAIHLWDATDFEATTLLHNSSQDQVLSLAFSPDGRWLAAGTVRGARIWTAIDEAGNLPRSTRFFAFHDSDSLAVSASYAENWFRDRAVTITSFGSIAEAVGETSAGLYTLQPVPESLTLESVQVYEEPTGAFLGVAQRFIYTTFLGPASLTFFQTSEDLRLVDWPIDPRAAVFDISIAGMPGEAVLGGWDYAVTGEEGRRLWNLDAASVFIRWQSDGGNFSVFLDHPYNAFFGGPADESLSLDDLLEMIETAWIEYE